MVHSLACLRSEKTREHEKKRKSCSSCLIEDAKNMNDIFFNRKKIENNFLVTKVETFLIGRSIFPFSIEKRSTHDSQPDAALSNQERPR